MLLVSLTAALGALGVAQATDCDFSGGFALREPSGCPTNTTVCGAGYEPRCCPAGLSCFTTSGEYCCPDGDEDCVQDVNNVPRCPDPSWTLWDSGAINGSWCCGPQMFGLGVPGGAGCTPLGSTLAAGQTLATAVTDPPSTCTTSTSIPATTSSTPVTITGSTQSSSTVTSTPTATTTAQGSGNNGVGSSSNSNKASGHLHGGTIAGIAIGAIAGVVLSLLAAWWIARRTRRAGRGTDWTGVPQDLPPEPQPPLLQAELEGNSHAELEGKGLARNAQLSELAN